MKVCCVLSLELPHRGDSNEYTQHNIFNIKQKPTRKYPKYNNVCSYGILFLLGTPERVRNSHGKRAIGVRAIEVLLWFHDPCTRCSVDFGSISSKICFLFCDSAVKVHDSKAYINRNITRERISLRYTSSSFTFHGAVAVESSLLSHRT